MRSARSAAVLALVLLGALAKVSSEDIYWEGEDDAPNEFLEVKEDDSLLGSALKRLKRDSPFDWFSNIFEQQKEDAPDEHIDEENTTDRDEEELESTFGSGFPPSRESDLKEKTIRVSFVVIEPYRAEYSNRDSEQFQNLSKTLADAVNDLFEGLPGTQQASLVRIQSRVSDEFSCNVTLDITTMGFDDVDRITDTLRNHIRERRQLGTVAVSVADFTAVPTDPDMTLPECSREDFRCDDGQCLAGWARCNGRNDCGDGSDEQGCRDTSLTTTTPVNIWNEVDEGEETDDSGKIFGNEVETDTETSPPGECRDPIQCISSVKSYCPDQICNRQVDCPLGEDEQDCNFDQKTECLPGEMQCDFTRCVLLAKKCDGVRDCFDGADELGCESETCGIDDFRCNNGRCIEKSRRCDSVVDCSSSEDEENCPCSTDQFQCEGDGTCIEKRKRCDGYKHCMDGSDERGCACSSDQWQCDFGGCVKQSQRCDGRFDCPSDRSDERHCVARGYFKCRSGKLIPDHLRCNRRYDCPPGDQSDERSCPCGKDDFVCDNGFCIPSSKHCDRTHDCQDGSDERNCSYAETICMASEYKCANGACVQADARCNTTVECSDGSDEIGCSCKRDEFHCRDGTCINSSLRCNGHRDCRPDGEDEFNCGAPTCPPGSFTCDNGACATPCDNIPECSPNGEDELSCPSRDCNHYCDGRCLDDELICNKVADCSDGSDEQDCDHCDGPDDFRCGDGECIGAINRCNGISECADHSDEYDCKNTVFPVSQGCYESQFQCRDGSCIDNQFYCDGRTDCDDNSDEENCQCDYGSFKCVSGQCISDAAVCDGRPDCPDNSDEANCATSAPYAPPTETSRPFHPRPEYPNFPSTSTYRPPFSTTGLPTRPPYVAGNQGNQDGCNRDEWRCENGPCISARRRCDGRLDCPNDDSDELDCPPDSPVPLNLKTYPNEQTERFGGDVVFQCRDEGPARAPVRWVREGGRPLKPGSTDRKGRLEMFGVTTADSGVYICQATGYLGYSGSELRVFLKVDSPVATPRPHSFVACQSHEATCGNGQCIAKSLVCDGRYDCDDRSDEDNCNQSGQCEPNQYQCANRRCVLKTWLCDSEDDCGDGSDEQSCGTSAPGQVCLPVEFACSTNNQCVPKSFHCDGQSDCTDGSDEVGCAPVHIRKPPHPQNLVLQAGETLNLTCEAVGIPTPLITWRLNWGHVPDKCRSTSHNGYGQLVCPYMGAEDSGAYSCEAINNKGTTFAVPDAIVFVNRSDPCPPGTFNSEASSANECIRCFCFGEATTCKSADLFTYNMPTPLGEGGTRLVGVRSNHTGEVSIDPQPITDKFVYQPVRNGVVVTKLETYNYRNSHPYVTLPEQYNGNQLTSYGGYIKYRMLPHVLRASSYESPIPDIIIKGKYGTLVHFHRGRADRERGVEARLTPEHWLKPSPRGPVPASREDIMMTIDDIDMIMVLAEVNEAGVNITNFSMESAQHINVGLGSATLVEECACPGGYEGLSCQKCAAGYERQNSGPWLGNCVRKERTCPPGMFGNPDNGYPCQPCPCPLTNKGNQFARTCSLRNGRPVCDCMPGYEGDNCEVCAPGFTGNPLVPGDSCQPEVVNYCNPVGTLRSRSSDLCDCKDNVRGRYCDQCNEDSFYLSPDFRHGCAKCFCTGVTQQCSSSNLRRKTTTVVFNAPQLVEQVKVYNSTPVGSSGAIRYKAPVETDVTPFYYAGGVSLRVDRARPTIYYWSLPVAFCGDKVTSYGGYLRYNLANIPYSVRSGGNNAADVQLISDNHLTFHYFADITPSSDGNLNASIQFLEKGWQRPDGKEVQREHLLLALADVKAILIKATYTPGEVATLVSASVDTAENNGEGPQALHVEQCVCPQGYLGTSCEDCAPGYTRSASGLYLEHCDRCDCSGHSDMCHPETGVCYDCKDNTDGDSCENCKPGYEKDAYGYCVESFAPRPDGGDRCNCDARGEAGPCVGGQCYCKPNVMGMLCEVCRPGTFGLDAANRDGCLPCFCSGVTDDCHDGKHYTKIPMPAPIFGEDFGGYTLTNLNADNVINNQFVPAANESDLMYIFSYPPTEELYWSLPGFSGNRILSYGGKLSLSQKFETGGAPASSARGNDVVLVGDDLTLVWTNPQTLRSGESLAYKVPMVEEGWFQLNTGSPVSRNDFMEVLSSLRRVLVRATLVMDIQSTSIADVSLDTAIDNLDGPPAKGIEVCICPEGYTGTSCETCSRGYYKDESRQCRPCPCNGNECQLGPYGDVICNCRPPYTGRDCSSLAGDSSTDYTTRPPPPQSTVVVRITSPTIMIQEVGGSVNFTCTAQSRMTQSPPKIQWKKEDGYLPQGRTIDDNRGQLIIYNVQTIDSGRYICQASDGVSIEEAAATLQVPGNQMTVPSVSIKPTYKDYYEGDRIQLECTANGNPSPKITWQRSMNRALPYSSTNFETFFVIESAAVEDSGEYRCIATNSAGSTDRTAVINVRPRPTASRVKLTTTPGSATILEGQSTRVVCSGSVNIPSESIDWIRQDGTQFLPNVQSSNGVLYIEQATFDNQGVYVCRAASPEIAPVPVLVSVEPLTTESPRETSNVTVNASRLKIPTGGMGQVECIPNGYPLPVITWSKHMGKMGPGTSQRDNYLIITDAREDDTGYYLCEGKVNNEPLANVYVYVDIEKREPPRVEIWPQGEIGVPLASSFEFRCPVMGGYPEPDVTWSRNGGRPLSPHVQLLPQNVLKFEKIEVNDEGEYTCTGANLAGTHSASAVLKVRSPPEITLNPDYVAVVRGQPVVISCRASGYPEPVVSIRKDVPEFREIVAPTPSQAVLRVQSASYSDEGTYTCTAASAAGTTKQQFAVNIDRGDGGFAGAGYGSGEEPYDPNFDSESRPNSMVAIEGQDSTLTCNASQEFDVTWSRDGQPLQSNAYQTGNQLRITGTSKSDEGYYECTLINRNNGEPQQSALTLLEVMRSPKITLRPPTQTVHPGQSPTVDCVVDGDNILEVSWNVLPKNRPQSSRVEIRGPTLIFHQIEVEDAGEYECFAKNSVANASAVAEVIVNDDWNRQPLESHDNEQFAHVGATVHLSCNVTQRNLQIRWTKNGRQLPRTLRPKPDGSLFINRAQKSDSGRYVCVIEDSYGRSTTNYINLHIEGMPEETPSLVSVVGPARQYIVGENVAVDCRARNRDVTVTWERLGTRQFVNAASYGDGSVLRIDGVEESDAGVYRCNGRDLYGHTSSEDFNLEVLPGSEEPPFQEKGDNPVYIARLKDNVVLPCTHDLEPPVNIEWRKEYLNLPSDVRANEPHLRLYNITEADAGTYICRVSNSRISVETRATMRVVGVVPRFDGNSWVSLPKLNDAYTRFIIEISIKPEHSDGLVLYNDFNQGEGDYIALQLTNSAPLFTLETGTGPVSVIGDRPLTLNNWHTIRVSWSGDKLTMDVDNTGPFVKPISGSPSILELKQNLFIGGVPDYNQLPEQLGAPNGFIGCVSMLVLGTKEVNVNLDSIDSYNTKECETCSPNYCLNNGVCQEARNERGYVCLCASGFAGQDCSRVGDACRPGVCGPGKCSDTADGFTCSCPITHKGDRCEIEQSIEYPGFSGNAFLAIKKKFNNRYFLMSLKVKPWTYPAPDGIIMYSAETNRGYGAFTSLAVKDAHLEFRFSLGDNYGPVILRSRSPLMGNKWTAVKLVRTAGSVSMTVDMTETVNGTVAPPGKELTLTTNFYFGGYDHTMVLNNNSGVQGGFLGCIKDVEVLGGRIDIVNSAVESSGIQECKETKDRGDIPEEEFRLPSCYSTRCRNGGYCQSPDAPACACQPGFVGKHCETRLPTGTYNPCAASPCQNRGICKNTPGNRLNYTCDCPLGYAGVNCQLGLHLTESVAFNGDGYLELPARLVRYTNSREPVIFAMSVHTLTDGVLLYQREVNERGDYVLLRVENGRVMMEWDMGSGAVSVVVYEALITDGRRHQVIAKLYPDHGSLSVDGYTSSSEYNGFSNTMNADSNIYLGGIPEALNPERYPGLNGCFEQVEIGETVGRALMLGDIAAAGRNTKRCKDPQ